MMRLPDIDSMVLGFIGPRCAPVLVSTIVPGDRPATFVRAWRNGGAAINRVLERATVTVDVWAPDSVEASDLAGNIRHWFHNDYMAMPLVRGVEEISAPYSIPDDASGSPRYRFSIALMVRAGR